MRQLLVIASIVAVMPRAAAADELPSQPKRPTEVAPEGAKDAAVGDDSSGKAVAGKDAAGRADSTGGDADRHDRDSVDSDDSDAGPVHVKVPATLRGKGYRLRYGGDVAELDGRDLAIDDSGAYYTFQIVDRDGRVLDVDSGYLDDDALLDMSPNEFRVGINVGSTSMRSADFADLLQDKSLSEQSLDFVWLPGALGLAVSIATADSQELVESEITSDFSETQWRVGAIYEIAPFSYSARSFNRLHFDFTLALTRFADSIAINDGVVEIKDESQSNGLYVGAEALFPVYDFWFSLRVYNAVGKIAFDDLGYKDTARREGVLVGGYYAF